MQPHCLGSLIPRLPFDHLKGQESSVERTSPRWSACSKRNKAGRSWNVVWCSVGNIKKVDPLRSPRWRTTLCPHLGNDAIRIRYLRSITELRLLQYDRRNGMSLKIVPLFWTKQTNTKKSEMLRLKGLRVLYGRQPERNYSLQYWRPKTYKFRRINWHTVSLFHTVQILPGKNNFSSLFTCGCKPCK